MIKIKIYFIVACVFFVCNSAITFAATQNCLSCHSNPVPPQKMVSVIDGVHFKKDILCQDCHGGNPELTSMQKVRVSAGYRGVPKYEEVPVFCSRCHSNVTYMNDKMSQLPVNQFSLYLNSGHAKSLTKNKDAKAANCVSCHGVHHILSKDDLNSPTHVSQMSQTCARCHANIDHMRNYDMPTNQYADYMASIHAKALIKNNNFKAPTCHSCHGAHDTKIIKPNHVSATCGSCHVREMVFFDSSRHKKAFVDNGMAECVFCHGAHKIEKPGDHWLGSGKKSKCAQCHSVEDMTKGIMTANEMQTGLNILLDARQKAELAWKKARPNENTKEELAPVFNGIDKAIKDARQLVHTFRLETFRPIVEAAIKKANEIETQSHKLIKSHQYKWFAWPVIAACLLIFVLLLTVSRRR